MTPARQHEAAAPAEPTAPAPAEHDPTTNSPSAPPSDLTPPEVSTPAPEEDSSPPPGHRVVLIDPRQDRRALMRQLLEQSADLKIVGMAASLAEAETQIRTEKATVAVVEIQMPVEDGLAAIASLRGQFPVLRIAVCSFHNDPATREAALVGGADAYLSKPPTARDLRALVAGPA